MSQEKPNVTLMENIRAVAGIVIPLTVVGVLAGASLVGVYNYAMPKIQVNIVGETSKAIKSIFPGLEKTEKIGNEDVYRVKDNSGKLIGYAFLAEGNGYQGVIKLIVGIDSAITKLVGMEVLESSETPGLGAEITVEYFKKQFRDLPVTRPVEYVKNQLPSQPNQIQAITGATISSRAVVSTINKRMEEIRNILKAEK